ncbi:MAG TPA: nodulation protein NfeD [Solirubrobacterales bacterium]|nr:nodulation protein NfeD [Solirubrobacterales bacterium]
MRIRLALLTLLAGLVLGGVSLAQNDTGTALSIELSGSIDPATEAWMDRSLKDAADEGAELVIVRLDTPGGLDTSMREIVKDIIAAPMPVVVYVSPDGARAASAGLFVTQAADVAAMAPQTNIGSASPISIGGADIDEVLGRKIENDAAAYVRALAEEHGRNPDLAEEMVRDATNVTAAEALEAGLIDIVATDTEDLLAQLDGFEVQGPKAETLDTAGLVVVERDMPLQYDLLQFIVNPNVAFLLILAGVIGIVIEIFSPGLIVPGATGLVALIIGLFGSSQLPVTAAGIVLLLLGIGLLLAETQLPTGGVVGILGVVSLAISGLLLYDTDSEGFGVSAPLIIAVAVFFGIATIFVGRKVAQAHKGKVYTGHEEMISSEGDVRVPIDPVGQVFVLGALWRAEPVSELEGEVIPTGARVRVEEVEGLTLRVRPVSDGTQEPT